MQSFQNRIEDWRAGRSLHVCAEIIGVGVTTFYSWTQGGMPSHLAIPAVADALGLPADELRAQILAEREARAAAKAKPQQVAS
jgi:hypothetical protein